MEFGDHHILIVEDEQPIRRFLRASLSSEGYRVTEAPSGTQGLQMAVAQPPDLVILDLGLPDLDGQDVLQRLREWCSAPIIILSARDQESQKIKALDHGADDYVTKPLALVSCWPEYAPRYDMLIEPAWKRQRYPSEISKSTLLPELSSAGMRSSI